MSDLFVINNTSYIDYRTDYLTDKGTGKYYIRQADFNNVFDYDNYSFGCSIEQRNPIVADRLLMFGDFYYSEIRFEKPALSLNQSHTIYGEEFWLYDRFHFTYTSPYIWGYYDGKRYFNHAWEDVPSQVFAYADLTNIRQDIDFSKGFFLHLAYDSSRYDSGQQESVRDRFWDRSELSAFIRTIDRTQYPVYYNYITSNFTNGCVLLDTREHVYFQWQGEIRIAYISNTGQLKDINFSLIASATTNHLQLLVPFDANELTAAKCANSGWSQHNINTIRQWIEGR